MTPVGEARRLRVLFVCGRNQWRSPTAEAMYRDDPRVEARSVGVSPKARRRLREADLHWADLILVMEREHKRRIADAFPHHDKLATVHSLDIPDEFQFMQPELVEWLVAAIEPWIDQAESTHQVSPPHDL